ncbi:unnamed protein product [Penicillium egyptiacum]|uniref:FAD-binding PCMH-type domain-containing protein n=1 Tax=Penicillium egyptiacum TaxID=1303716 RepID=A0A9W4K6T9_9EURO|nr:unnamed protein product [Penicillium egyptiacum]
MCYPCKTPNDPCWPSTLEWSSLNETVSGRLIKTKPPGSVCYPTESDYNLSACNNILENWTTSVFHSSNPSSVSDLVYSNSSCSPIYPNGTNVSGDPDAEVEGGSMGNLSPYVVNAMEASHVQAALEFAHRRNWRLNIKDTGHNPEKRIWTHFMKGCKFHESFKPQTCGGLEGHMAATVGAGIQDGELFQFLAQNDAIADVGVVGWATGGGHGLATAEYGMGADNIIEAVLVTPHGEAVTTNACQNKDLYWAIRGGGGGTFGVILSVTVRAYPMLSITRVDIDISARNGTSPKHWWILIAKIHKELLYLQDAGLGGSCTTFSGPPFYFHDTLLQYNTSNADSADESVKPLKGLLGYANESVESTITTSWSSSWYDLIKLLPATENVGTKRSIRASRLLPRRAIENTMGLAYILEEIGPQQVPLDNGISNPSISGTMTISKVQTDNALNPAWREAAVHFITSQQWNDTLPNSIAEGAIESMTYDKGYYLRQLAPDSGAYYNEA